MSCSSLSQRFPRGSWFDRLEGEFKEPYMQDLCRFLEHERALWPNDVHPQPECIFEAFRLTPWEEVRVVILGRDPYTEVGQATGLAFGLPRTAPLTTSLHRIKKELGGNLRDQALTSWAKQGVLLLNTVLTVFGPAGSGSHEMRGWECFTDVVIRKLFQEHENRLVFLLWGRAARTTAARVGLKETSARKLVYAPHPAWRNGQAQKGFVGSEIFKRANSALRPPKIDWTRGPRENAQSAGHAAGVGGAGE